MNRLRKLTALGAFFVLAAGVAGCGSGIPGNSVASVSGNPITTQAFDHWMYVEEKGNASEEAEEGESTPVIVPEDPPGFQGCIKQVRDQIPSLDKTPDKTIKADCKQLFTSLTSQVMSFLIDSYWYQADAHRLGITLSNAKLQQIITQQRKAGGLSSASAYDAYLKESGKTQADIEYQFRTSQLEEDLVKRYTKKVTPAAISAYYQSHSSQFGTAATRNVRIVLTKSLSTANTAKSALDRGQSWATVAKKYSTDSATKDSGGLLTNVTNGEEEKQLNTAIFSSPLNKIEGPIHTIFGYYVLEVVKATAGTHQSLAKETATIRELLTSQYATDAQNALTKAAQKRYGSQTLCRSLYAVSGCKGYKAPKTSTAAAGTAGASGATSGG